MPAFSEFMNIDQQLRTLELVQARFDGDDLVMLVDNAGTPVVGESLRKFPDNKSRMAISGYSWGMLMRPGAPGQVTGRNYSPFVVVRQTDAATASLASLVQSGTDKIKVCISAFRSGGDKTAADTLPMFEIEMEEVRITGQYLTTGGTMATLSEILVFAYRKLTLRSAAQQGTGARGAVRECVIASDNAA